MKEVSIIGATFYGNHGAEAMLSTTIGRLKEHSEGLHFNIFSYYAKIDRDLTDDEQLSLYRADPVYLVFVLCPLALLYSLLVRIHVNSLLGLFPASVRAIARSKVLICLSGVSFIDGREKFLPFNIAILFPAMVMGIPVVKFAQAVGPFKNKINRVAARLVLCRCDKVYARGDSTLENLQEYFGNRSFYEKADDIAFLFEEKYALSRVLHPVSEVIQECIKIKETGVKIVGLCPSRVILKELEAQGRNYVGELKEVIDGLVKSGNHVLIFPNATREMSMDKMHNNDLPMLHELKTLIGEKCKDSIIFVVHDVTAGQVNKLIGVCDVLVTSRFHAMIASLVLGTSVLVMGWSHKYYEVLRSFGQDDVVLGHGKEDFMRVHDVLCEIFDHYDERRQNIVEKLPVIKKSSEKQLQYVFRSFLNETS